MKNKNLKNKIKELNTSNSDVKVEQFSAFIAKPDNIDKFAKYDQEEPYKFIENYFWLDKIPNLSITQCFLYHGIRFQKHLEKLESIFEKKEILASKYLDDVISYDDNCNDGDYVSLLEIEPFEYSNMYEVFIRPNVTLVVSPFCEAYNTIYVSFQEWEEIKKSGRTFKNRFSYAQNEWQVKESVPLKDVVAIGIPYLYYGCLGKEEYANKLLEDVIALMKKYDLDFPVVDTSSSNRILYNPNINKSLVRKTK